MAKNNNGYRIYGKHGNGEILVGDALSTLQALDPAKYQPRCCVTSPPYWGLRDYGSKRFIGAEDDVVSYVKNLTDIFREVRRLMTDDGTLWLNIGDSYTSGDRTWRDPDKKNPARAMKYRPSTPDGLKPKDLVGVPWKVAFALQADGWFLRSEIIWHKTNCQPESVKDRPTRAHEHIFLFSKSESYYYDQEAIKESSNSHGNKRNKRTVWEVKTKPFPGAHFAVFPTELIVPCIEAGSEVGDLILDPFFGAGTVGVACEELGRKYVGIEIKEEYAKLSAGRLGWTVKGVKSG